MFRLSIDTGGTFTDGYLTGDGTTHTTKVPTTKHDLTVCFRECIDELAGELDLSTEALLIDTETIRFSTTIGTNTIIERSGPQVGLIVTEGYEDELANVAKGDETILSEDLVVGVPEETTEEGEVKSGIERKEVLGAAKTLMNRGAKLLVVSFANSFHNPENELEARRLIESEYPPHYLGSVRVFTAQEVTSRPGYRGRTYTGLVNGYIHRPMARSLYRAEDNVRDDGYDQPLLIGQSTGGVTRVSKTVALNTYNSGPVAGLLGADVLRKHYDEDTLVSTDMGGTSIDIGTIAGGEYARALTPGVGGLPVHLPMISVHTAGAGGGSIASVEDGGVSVGPESTGAEPGPACYDLGGFRPTVTDADVVLGFINPDYFLGGERQLNAERAEEAVERQVAGELDESVERAAARIRERVDSNIAENIEAQLRAHGSDPAATVLLAHGGAAPGHCCSFASEIGIDRIITTPSTAVFSAFGAATQDVEHRYTVPYGVSTTVSSPTLDKAAYNNHVEELEAEAIQDMRGEGFEADDLELTVRVIVKADSGIHEVPAPKRLDGPDELEPLISGVTEDVGTEIDLDTIVLQARGFVSGAELTSADLEGTDPSGGKHETRDVYWPNREWQETPIYRREGLVPGNEVSGPAVIEATDTTYVIPEDWTYQIDGYRNGIIERHA